MDFIERENEVSIFPVDCIYSMSHTVCLILYVHFSHQYQCQLVAQKPSQEPPQHPISCVEIQILITKSVSFNLNLNYFFSTSADMSFEGDTSEGSKNSNSNDGGGGGADADLIYFDESEMRYIFRKNCIAYTV